MNDQQFAEELIKQRKNKIDSAVRETQTTCLILDLPVHDQYYIDRRLREVLQNAINKANYKSAAVAKLRKEFLRENLDEVRKNLEGKRKFHPKAEDLTEKRDARCEDVVFEIAHKLLDGDLIFSEDEYIEKMFAEQQKHSLSLQLSGFTDSFFNLMEIAMELHLNEANMKLWKGKTREQITFRDVDAILKQK